MRSTGSWAFLIGVILAIIFALVKHYGTGIFPEWVGWVLVLIGLIVGFLNVTEKEIGPFLHAGAILVIVMYLGSDKINEIIPLFGAILDALLILFVPATVIVALKSLFNIASTK